MKGTGKLVTEITKVDLAPGDVISIPPGEKYYWEGNMTVMIPTAPTWYPEQHETSL